MHKATLIYHHNYWGLIALLSGLIAASVCLTLWVLPTALEEAAHPLKLVLE